MDEVAIGREDEEGVASCVGDQEISGLIHFESRRSGKVGEEFGT